MKAYKDVITLSKNNRGCYILDTVKGCSYSMKNKKGCYDNCYAASIANRYKFDFSNPVVRNFKYDKKQLYLFDFKDPKHIDEILFGIEKIDMPFVRIGEMGDPSENWEHTIKVCEIISMVKKPIVIITKHWKTLSKKLLKKISSMNICLNTSISALDCDYEIEHRLNQYNKLKDYCNSVLRIVSCDFNKDNSEGFVRSKTQEKLFDNEKIIDTIFRPSKNNKYVKKNIINIEKKRFLKSEVLASVYNKSNYFGYCNKCPDMCGLKDN